MSDPDQKRLTEYWVRRNELAREEWEEFYLCVRRALLRCPASELAVLPDQRTNYIDEFFAEKIFFRAASAGRDGIQSISGGALCSFFRRYLIDLLRGNQKLCSIEADGLDTLSADKSDDECDSIVREFIVHIGGEEQLSQRIGEFLANLEDWALLMLRGHFCADDDAIPMAKLCKGISSYHYKAQKLGVTVKRGDAEMLGYEHTLIGRWMTSLGVEITASNIPVIHYLLGAICLAAVLDTAESA